MKKQKTLYSLVILDASSSMGGMVTEVKGGLKQLFTDIKSKKGDLKSETIVVDFSGGGDFNILTNIGQKLDDSIADKYHTRGMTALYDAIGKAFALIPKNEKNVFVTIFTDGLENDSKEFKYGTIKKLLENKRKLGWAITFTGSNEDAMANSDNLGFSKGMSKLSSITSSFGAKGKSGTIGLARTAYYSAVEQNKVTTDTLSNLMNVAEEQKEKLDNQK